MSFWTNIKSKFNTTEKQDAVTYHIDSLVNDDGKMSVKGWIFSTQMDLKQIHIILYSILLIGLPYPRIKPGFFTLFLF